MRRVGTRARSLARCGAAVAVLLCGWGLGGCGEGDEGGVDGSTGDATDAQARAHGPPLEDAALLARGEALLAAAKCKTPALPVTCPGAAPPAFALKDFQPQSPRFGQSYGLEVFKGKVVILAMLAAW